jgi:signal transduction histidine kinase
MKTFRDIAYTLKSRLAFRIVAPVILTMAVTGTAIYLFVLNTISDFITRHVNDSLTTLSRDIYNICDANFNELLRIGQTEDEKEVRVKKALTIGQIEEFMRANGLAGLITEAAKGDAQKEVLRTADITSLLITGIEKNKDIRTAVIKGNGKRYYARRLDFEPWKWDILILKDIKAYSDITNKLILAYISTALIFLVSVIALLCYLNRSIKIPLDRIIQPLKRNELPDYRGIYEFEYISYNIRQMMTEKEGLMKQIMQEQKLKAVNMLAAGVAHNFNNMLVGVLGYASLISTRLEDAKREKQALQEQDIDELLKFARTIESSANKAGGLARELAVLSRKRMLEKESVMPIDINKLISEFQRFLSGTFPKSIEITAEMNDGLPAIKGNIMQLEQALLNIAINSKDAMPDGGKLTMKTFLTDVVNGNFKYPYLKAGKYVTIQISDTGAGIDEATLSHIFEPFFTTKPVDKGTGLGLATVYSIIKAHRGYVIAESIPDKGSTFTIYLPISE